MPSKHRPKHAAPSRFSKPGRRPSSDRLSSSDPFSDGIGSSPPASRAPEDGDLLDRDGYQPRRKPAEAPPARGPRLIDLNEARSETLPRRKPEPVESPRDPEPPAPKPAPKNDTKPTRNLDFIDIREPSPSDFGRSVGEDFWNESPRPKRRSGEGGRRDHTQTSVMEVPAPKPREVPLERESRSMRAAGVKVTPARPTRGAADRLPPEELSRTSVWPEDDDDLFANERPYARARKKVAEEPTMAVENVEPASPKAARKAKKKAAHHESQSLGQWFKEITILGVVAVGTAVLLTTYLIQAFFIPSASMENTLLIGDRVLVNKFAYKFGEPSRNDIVVFTSPEGVLAPPPANTPFAKFMDKVAIAIGLKSSQQDLIKRVIAVEGQKIEGRLGLVFVDGVQLDEPFRKDTNPIADFAPVEVPQGHVYVMGDNRNDSKDSRSFGPVPLTTVVGKAFARIWPLDRATWFKK